MVRGSPLVVLLLATLAAVPPGHAQSDPAAPLLSDPAGDVQIVVNGAPTVPDGAAAYSSADLRALEIVETPTEFLFTFTVEDLKPADQETAAEGFSMTAYFTHNGREFSVESGRGVAGLATAFWGYVRSRDAPAADWSVLLFTIEEIQADFEADTLVFPVPRDLLADAQGAAPYPGRSLEALRARSGGSLRDDPLFTGLDPVPDVVFPASAVDDMPDDPAAAPSYAVRLGLAQTGHAYLSSELPFRASNGEATTYIIQATASNLGDKADTFTLAAEGVSGRIAVVVPVQVLALEAGAEREVPVLVTVPFGHQHGALESFVLEMRSETDPGSVGRIAMGVRFLDVPQPAGHHDTLYLHAGAEQAGIGPVLTFRDSFMSTLPEDPLATLANYYSNGQGGIPGQWTYYFHFPLHPSLQLGLDFDLARAGRLAVPVGATEPMLGTTLEGELYVYTASEGSMPSPFIQQETTVLATFAPTEPVDIMPNSEHLFELEFEPSEDADLLPHEKGRQMVLALRVTTLSAAPTFGVADAGAYVAPGGSLRLPLNEWHDPVDETLAALSGPGLSPLGAQERQVNPGEAVVFDVSIANPTDGALDMVLEVSGPNAAWATLPATKVEVPAHDTARASVIVRAPADAVSGQRADLVLQAYAQDDPTARGLLRFVTVVDTDADHPDDTALAADLSKKESPAPGAALALCVVALLALALRRRR